MSKIKRIQLDRKLRSPEGKYKQGARMNLQPSFSAAPNAITLSENTAKRSDFKGNISEACFIAEKSRLQQRFEPLRF
jgi:hypothetical protein